MDPDAGRTDPRYFRVIHSYTDTDSKRLCIFLQKILSPAGRIGFLRGGFDSDVDNRTRHSFRYQVRRTLGFHTPDCLCGGIWTKSSHVKKRGVGAG